MENLHFALTLSPSYSASYSGIINLFVVFRTVVLDTEGL